MNQEEEARPMRGSVPVPDPTRLTTDAVNAATAVFRRELDQLKELVFERIDGDRREISQRFATLTEKLFAHDNEFRFVEDRRVEQKLDTEKAVQAALSAAKEAVSEQTTAGKEAIGKSENATTSAINALAEQQRRDAEQQRRDTDELKARVGSMESMKKGGADAVALGITVFVAILLAIGLIVSLTQL